MNTKKQLPKDKLQKSSIIFMQLGLILALVLTYSTLELKFEQKPLVIFDKQDSTTDVYIPNDLGVVKIKRKQRLLVEASKPKSKTANLEKFKKVKNNEVLVTTIFKPEDPVESINTNEVIDELPDITFIEDDEEIDFIKVEKKPTFKECKHLKDEKQNACFQKQMFKYINRNLIYPKRAIDNGQEGRALIEFIIDENGDVIDVKTYKEMSQYKALDKAAIKAVKKLPKMIPGKQRNKKVKVKYVVPVNFKLN